MVLEGRISNLQILARLGPILSWDLGQHTVKWTGVKIKCACCPSVSSGHSTGKNRLASLYLSRLFSNLSK